MQWRIQDFPLGGADLRRIHFSAKTYAKTKEMDPVGGGGAHAGSTPPGSADEMNTNVGSYIPIVPKCQVNKWF